MIQIPNIAEETKEKIKRSSAYSLPNNPTGAGYKPQDIKNVLFKPIIDGQNSVLAEVEKLISRLNNIINQNLANGLSLQYDTNTKKLTYKLESAEGKILTPGEVSLPFLDRVEKTNGEHAYTIINGEQTTKRISPMVVAGAIVSRDPNGRTAFPDPILSNEPVTRGYFENNVISSFSYEMGDDYKIKLMLKNENGNTIGEVEIDLPIESMIVNASYSTGYLRLELQNGNTLDVDVSDIISGLVNETDFKKEIANINTKLQNVSGKSQVLLYEVGDETNITNFINTFLQYNYDNLNSGDILVVRYYYDEYYKDYIYILRQESPMVMKTWHLLTVYDTGATIVEQLVNYSKKPVSSVAVKNELLLFSSAYDDIIEQAVVTREDFYDSATIDQATLDVQHNKDYHAVEDITNLLIRISSDEILCSVMFKIVDSGDFDIEIMGCQGYIGKAPDFKNGETWELSIHNGIVASGKVVSEWVYCWEEGC